MRRRLIMIGLFLVWGMALLVIKVRHNWAANVPSPSEMKGMTLMCEEIRDASDRDARLVAAYRVYHYMTALRHVGRQMPLSVFEEALGQPDRKTEDTSVYVLYETSDRSSVFFGCNGQCVLILRFAGKANPVVYSVEWFVPPMAWDMIEGDGTWI